MKKTLFIILALCSMSYGLSGYSLYKTYVAKDTVTHINLDSNFYRGVNWSNKLADTIDRNFIRWYDFNSHDSTLRYFKVDTIRSNPHVDSIAGNTVITGAPIVTGALTVDSLKSTKGINATGGTFSGRITGSDVEVSDSIKGVTGTFSGRINATNLQLSDSLKATTGSFSNLTAGYIPYQNSTGTIINGPIFTNGFNASVGKTSVEAWGGTYRALQIGGSCAWMGIAAEIGESNFYGLNNLYFDGAWKPYVNGTSARIHFGTSGFLFAYDTGVVADVGFTPTNRFSWTLDNGLNVTNNIVSSGSIEGVTGTFSGALTGTTLNTGYGANELYPMDQDQRTTASPTHVLGTYTNGVRAYNNTGYGSFIGMFKGIGMLPGYPSANYPVIKTDHNYVYFSASNKYCASIGEEYFDIVDTSSIDVQVFKVEKDTTKMHIAKADSVKLGTGSYLKTYLDTTFYDTLYNVETYVGRGLARIVCIGNVVTLYQPSITGTTSGPISIQGIPTKFLPSLSTSAPAMIRNNSNTEVGIYLLNSIYGFSILTSNFANPSDGTSGTRGCTVTWIIN